MTKVSQPRLGLPQEHGGTARRLRQPSRYARPHRTSSPWLAGLWVAFLALALIGLSFLLQAHTGLNLLDEGYLWYGAMAVAKGHVPLRDFMSYDPGRYYWTLVWFWLLGDRGIIPLRIACAAFNFLGIWCGLLVLRRLSRAWYVLVPAGVLLTLWVFPPYKLNHTVDLAAVYVAVLVIERPTLRRHLLTGVFVGLAAFFGRDHGVYGLAAFALLILFIWWKLDRRHLLHRAAVWGGGIILGYSPMLLMLAFVPGFWKVNFDIMRTMITELASTNIGKPIPWPWRQSTTWDVCVGLFFVLAPVVYAISAGWLATRTKDACMRQRVLAAATIVGIPYLHYAFSRADLWHLGQSLHPFLLASIALLFAVSGRLRWLAVTLVVSVAIASVIAVGAVTPVYQRTVAPAGAWVPTKLGRWTVWLPRWHAELVNGAIRFNASVVRPDEGFLITAQVPALYAILDRESPIWETIFVLPLPERWQRRMIDEMEQHRVNWVLFKDKGTDAREELRFRYTHPLMWEYIVREFEVVPERLPEDFYLFRRKGATVARPPSTAAALPMP